MNCKILVCCHKPGYVPENQFLMPIHCGKALSNLNLGIQGDDEGDNISAKNPFYCELTAMYWAWKNLKNVDVIGLCHYRRYFDFHHQVKPPWKRFLEKQITDFDLTVPSEVISQVCDGKIVVQCPSYLRTSLKLNFCWHHNSDDYRVLREIVLSNEDESLRWAFIDAMERKNKFVSCNMFLMRWSDFDTYCSWIFKILDLFYQKTDVSHYSTYQKRLCGFAAERLFNVWLYTRKKDVIYCPGLWFDNNVTESPRGYGKWAHVVYPAFYKMARILTSQF